MSGLRVVAMAFPAIVIAGAGSLLPRIRGNPGFWLLRIRGSPGFWLLRIREGPGFWLVCGLVFFSDTFLWRAEGLFLWRGTGGQPVKPVCQEILCNFFDIE